MRDGKFDGLTPQEIHERNQQQKALARTQELRERFKLEAQMDALPKDIKKKIKLDLLRDKGYKGEVPTRHDDMMLRIVYYMRLDRIHKESIFRNYFERNRWAYATDQLGRSDHGDMDDNGYRSEELTSNAIFRDAFDEVS